MKLGSESNSSQSIIAKSKLMISRVYKIALGIFLFLGFSHFSKALKLRRINQVAPQYSENHNKAALISLIKGIVVLCLYTLFFIVFKAVLIDILRDLGVLDFPEIAFDKYNLVEISRNGLILKHYLMSIVAKLSPVLKIEIFNSLLLFLSTGLLIHLISLSLLKDDIYKRTKKARRAALANGIIRDPRSENKNENTMNSSAAEEYESLIATPVGIYIISRNKTEEEIRKNTLFWESLNQTPMKGLQGSRDTQKRFFPIGFVLKPQYLFKVSDLKRGNK